MQFKKNALIVFIFLCLGFLSFHAWTACISPDNNTIYSSSTPKKLQALALEAQQMRERLSYMVFAKERKQTQTRLIEVLQQQLNLMPWSVGLWRDYFLPLTEVEAKVTARNNAEFSQTELDWAFTVVTKMQKWNRQERFLLINRCVKQSQRTSGTWISLCNELLNQVWNEPNRRLLLRNLQVDTQELNEAFDIYGVIRPPWMLR